MKLLFYVTVFFTFSPAVCQVAKDTSFTLMSEYLKQHKKFPYIQMVQHKSVAVVSEHTDVVYHNQAGRNLHLDAFICHAIQKLPAVVLLHGGGWKSGNKFMMHPLAQEIALHGYHCFAVEYRLSDEARYPAAIDDVLQAVAYIEKQAEQWNVDTGRIAILGCSSGGQLASLLGTTTNKIKAIVNIDGILAFHHPESAEGRSAALWLGGTYQEIPDIWHEASALSHINPKTPPILFINSQFERFHAGRDDMILQLNDFGIDSRVETIPESPHTFWLFHPWFDKTVQYTIKFLDDKLKP